MKVIYKYQIYQDITKLPAGAKILNVGIQYGDLYAWAIVNTGETNMIDSIVCKGTGHELPVEHDIFLHRSDVVLCKDDMGKTSFGVYDHKRGIWDTPFNVIRWTEIPK